jgi:hypothetical protein
VPKRIGSSFTDQPKKRKYDDLFDSVADGQVWLLEATKDYSCSEGSLRDHAKVYAEAKGLHFAVNVIRKDGRPIGVEIAFVQKGRPLPALAGAQRDTEHGQEHHAEAA